MKTLDQIPPTWSEKITTGRFVDALGGAAVLDKETGLVWEKSPSTSKFILFNAQIHCNDRTVGNRKGWRIPTVQELASLIDPSVPPPGPTIPAGHPFSNVGEFYWSATTGLYGMWGVWFYYGGVLVSLPQDSNNVLVWCVRGGQGVDSQ